MACEVCQKFYVLNLDDDYFDSDAKPHVCSTCGQSFSLKIQLKRHTLLHANGASYVCVHCLKESESSESKSYNLRLSKKNEGYTCDVCGESFGSKRMLLRHSNKQHVFEKTFLCDDCPECFGNASELKKHSFTHKTKNVTKKNFQKSESSSEQPNPKSSSTPKTLSCTTCNKSFAYQACLDKHVRICETKSKSSDLSHIEEDISKINDKRFSKKFKDRIDARNKRNSKKSKSYDGVSDTDDKKHICNICGKSFTRRSALEGHELGHITEKFDSPDEFSDDSRHSDDYVSEPKKPRLSKINIQQSYMCELCNFVCFSKQTLNKHLNNHKEREKRPPSPESNEGESIYPYECPTCDMNFESLEKLQEHNLIHVKKEMGHKSTEKETGDFPCEICEKIFHSKSRLKKHLLYHVTRDQDDDTAPVKWGPGRKLRSKDYGCEICGKRFAGAACLKKHSAKHVNGEPLPKKKPRKKEKPIQTNTCEFCNEEFTGKRGAYIRHLHTHTPEVCGICDERFVDRQSLREHCKVHVGTEEGRMFMECSQKALDAKNGLLPPEPKVEYIYLVLR